MIDFKLNKYVIGVDEAGRGPLAGPVVAAAIIADESIMNLDVKDSKLLSGRKRKELFTYLTQKYPFAVSVIGPSVIDKINILNATKQAMTMVISELSFKENLIVYVDGNQKPYEDENIVTVVKGDRLLKPISAASIIAKVWRDEIMLKLSNDYPQYLWNKNFGYGTKEHYESIIKYGVSAHHRRSFLKKLHK